MTDPFQEFMQVNAAGHSAPLFSIGADGQVVVREKGAKRLICRHPEFEDLMIRTVEDGLQDPEWEGFVYVMHRMRGAEYVPLYIGKRSGGA